MKERPINMRPDEVRAILDGRKTQFRRVIREVPTYKHLGQSIMDWPLSGVYTDNDGNHWLDVQTAVDDYSHNKLSCPFGAPGDRLWVRECWGASADTNPETGLADILFRADQIAKKACRWRSSVHMPRWACRIILEVASVRVERLNEISEEDAKSEWCSPLSERCRRTPVCGSDDWPEFHGTHRDNFRCWWGSIYGPEDWDENPWVRAVEFRRLEVPND